MLFVIKLDNGGTHADVHSDGFARFSAGDAGRTRVDVACRRARAPPLLARQRSVRGRSAPRNRHSRRGRIGSARRGRRSGRLRGGHAAERQHRDDPDARWLLGHSRSPRHYRRESGRTPLRGRDGRDDRPERGGRVLGALRSPRRSRDGRAGGLCRSGAAAPGPPSPSARSAAKEERRGCAFDAAFTRAWDRPACRRLLCRSGGCVAVPHADRSRAGCSGAGRTAGLSRSGDRRTRCGCTSGRKRPYVIAPLDAALESRQDGPGAGPSRGNEGGRCGSYAPCCSDAVSSLRPGAGAHTRFGGAATGAGRPPRQ